MFMQNLVRSIKNSKVRDNLGGKTIPVRASARKKFMGGGGTIRKYKFAKKGDLSSEHFLEGLH